MAAAPRVARRSGIIAGRSNRERIARHQLHRQACSGPSSDTVPCDHSQTRMAGSGQLRAFVAPLNFALTALRSGEPRRGCSGILLLAHS